MAVQVQASDMQHAAGQGYSQNTGPTGTAAPSEFSVQGAFVGDRRTPIRWIVSHVRRNPLFIVGFVLLTLLHNAMTSTAAALTGTAFDAVLDDKRDTLTLIVVGVIALMLVRGVADLGAALSMEVLGKRLSRDAREELYLSLLSKSQTFHNRQRVGDIMARAANDVSMLSLMMTPGIGLLSDSIVSLGMPIIFIAFLDWRLLLAPLVFLVLFAITLRRFIHNLRPVAEAQRGAFGVLNAGLAQSITGIEVVKATAQELAEEGRFQHNARTFRDATVAQGAVQARYLPPLVLTLAQVLGLAQGIWLVQRGSLSIGELITFVSLMGVLHFATFISVFTFALVQLGVAGAERILETMNEETELDQNSGGHQAVMQGELVFEDVSFSYEGEPVLRNVSFRVQPGQTVAIVGQTGSGKTTLTRLVNRIFDVDSGRVLIDGVDVREWQLDSLRSQISTIEQDIVLFSRSIAGNIGFSLGQQVGREQIEQAARGAQAHDFIMTFRDGYETEVGERGVTLSGGQRQRIAIARALLSDPRMLMLDDSTSAVDSATEDEIQRAIRTLQEGRTTLLITHRLSQIRWADHILVLRNGTLLDQGTHDELHERCDLYHRMFAHYEDDDALPVPTAAD